MIKQKLNVFFRNINKSKLTFFINFIGLTSGITCSILLFLWVDDELNVDKFHTNDNELYQVKRKHSFDDAINIYDDSSVLLADVLKEEMPEVRSVVRIGAPIGKNTLSVSDKAVKSAGLYADKDFFNVFSFKMLEGNKNSALADNNNIVISKELALKLFGSNGNVIGKSIEFDKKQSFQVVGIFKTIPAESTLQFDFLLPFEMTFEHYPIFGQSWDNNYPETFVLLKKGARVSAFDEKIKNVIKDKSGDEFNTLFASKFSDGYLYGSYNNGKPDGGRIEYVRLFSIIGIFILLIACINFTNLSTARASKRLKEVGIRKTLGAKRKSLIVQFLGESIMIVLISFLISFLLTIILLPFFNEIAGKQIPLSLNMELVSFSIALILFTGLIAGVYPALYLSKFDAIKVLDGKLNTTFGEIWIRKGLVVFQFALSVILIVCVLVVYQQVSFIQNGNMGYDKDNIVSFDIEGKLKDNLETFLTEVENVPGVKSASGSFKFGSFFGKTGTTSALLWSGKSSDNDTELNFRLVDENTIDLLGIKMAEGRSFSKDFGSDSTKIVLNEAAIKLIGYEDPISKKVNLWDKELEIIGVAKDFHLESLQETIQPMLFYMLPEYFNTIMLKLDKGNLNQTLSGVNDFYTKFNPGFPLEYRFLDEDFQAMYTAENRVSALSKYFAGLAILISCLGLFGLAAFTAERRRKEISIRKVLGQNAAQVTFMLSGEFAKLVLISILIALPIAYLLTNNWLSGFAYRISLKTWYFFGAGLIAMMVALITVGSQAIKAANANPVDGLRDE